VAEALHTDLIEVVAKALYDLRALALHVEPQVSDELLARLLVACVVGYLLQRA
jgi:hypothetical protein